jgi:hypothetical protein
MLRRPPAAEPDGPEYCDQLLGTGFPRTFPWCSITVIEMKTKKVFNPSRQTEL